MEVRQRKVKVRDDDKFDRDAASPAKDSKRTYFVIVCILGALFLGYVAIANDIKPVRMGTMALDNLVHSLNWHKPFYVVIIDAGSTGSRLLAFSFHSSVINNHIILDDELFLNIKPGLSSFADNPEEGAKSLATLLNQAKEKIPKSEWDKTLFSMRATAGLRLLPREKADRLLEECKNLIDSSGFVVNKNSVSIMEERDEGIFAWFTVNFLVDRLSYHNTNNTGAALDLGGGSVQVTYAPRKADLQGTNEYSYEVNAFGSNMNVYTHSYLGMGLMAARKEILTHGVNLEEQKTNDKILINSECINPIISKTWTYGGRNYLVKGPKNPAHKIVKTQNYAGTNEDRPIVRFAECKKIISNYVNTIKNKPVGLKDYEIYAFSYFFDRATEAGLVDPKLGGVLTVDSFHTAAIETCEYPNNEQPFMCLDLTFISVLLQEGFGLEPKTKLYLYKKINGHELSWALGAAFSLFERF